MLAQRLSLILIMQHARPFDDEINLLLAVVEYSLAIAVRIQSDFAEASYGLQRSNVFIALSEHRPVVAGLRGEIGLRLRQVGKVAMQPGGIRRPVLGSKTMCDSQQVDSSSIFNFGADC